MTEDKLFDNLSEQLFPNKMSWGGHAEDVSKLVVAAYNKALEDAIKVGEGDPYIYIYDIKKLRI